MVNDLFSPSGLYIEAGEGRGRVGGGGKRLHSPSSARSEIGK